ncbi:unnamed protein product [Meganyctiphanes norvegica]|uniref:Vitellinogen open beta-sheet domain-containing protein n=1 Tax=Meganyctiphanes norvegica TaxID=48144 RepID=A0AAV2PLV4_MEGNR
MDGLSERPKLFLQLIDYLDQDQGGEFYTIWDQELNDKHREFLKDGLMACRSSSCIELVTSEVQGAFTDAQIIQWLQGLHFHGNPGPKDIAQIMSLVEFEWNHRSESLLAASSMVWQRCQKHPVTCHQDAKPLLHYAESVIDKQCSYHDTETWANIKLVLRALGNAGTLPDHYFPQRCYRNKLACPEIRDAALQAYRKTSCPDYKTVMEILRDSLDDVDVRISAYLSLVPCVSEHPYFFRDIQDLLEHEEVNQVGSFIWTHVNNLVHSAKVGIDSEKLSKFASAYHLKDKWDTNAWKSSRNYRVDRFNEQRTFGTSMDTDIIFKPDSYLPFQAKVNFTLDVLDKSFNVLEIGGTFKRFENHVDNILSNNGYFNNEVLENVMKSLRSKREVGNKKLEEYQRIYNEINNTEEEENLTSRASIFIRVFGKEIIYNENLMNADPLRYFLNILDQVSNSNNYHKIINEEFVMPTILGLPLTFKLEAVSSLSMEKTFNQDRFSLSGSFSPKAVMSVEESVTVHGYGAKSGIRWKTMYTASSNFGANIDMKNGFDIQFNIPEHNLIKVSKNSMIELYQSSDMIWEETGNFREGEADCSDSEPFSNSFGLALCSASENLVGEFNGNKQRENLSWSYYIKKIDTFDHYRMTIENKYPNYQFLIDTPGSTVNRKVELRGTATGDIRRDKMEIEAKVDFLDYNYMAVVGITSNGNKDEFKFEMSQNSQEIATFGYLEEHVDNASEITAYINVQDIVDLNYNGNLAQDFRSEDKNYLKLDGQFSSSAVDEPLKIEAYGEIENENMATKVTVGYGSFITTVNTEAEFSNDKILFGMRSEYGKDGQKENYEIFFMNENIFEENHAVIVGDFKLQVSVLDGFNIDGGYRLHPFSKEINFRSNIQGVQKIGRLVSTDRFDNDHRDFQVTFEFSDPNQEDRYVAHLLYKKTANALQAEVEASYGDSFYWKSSTSYLLERDPLHVLAGLHIQLNDFVIQASNNIDLSQDNHVSFLVGGQLGPAHTSILFDVDYDISQPLNATFTAGFGYGSQWMGINHITTSNNDWSITNGTTEVSWFDWSYKTYHLLRWSDDQKYLELTNKKDMMLHIDIMNESPTSTMVDSSPYEWNLLILTTKDNEDSYHYEIRVTNYLENQIFLYVNVDRNRFNASWTFKDDDESSLIIDGRYNIHDVDNMEISANLELKVESGSYHSDLNAKSSYNGTIRDIMFSGTYDGDIIESEIRLINDDGWFNEYHQGIIIEFTSPFERMNLFKFGYESSSDSKQDDYISIEWEQFKVRGSLRTGDWNDLEAKIEYKDGASEGSSCNSYVQVTHRFDGQHYESAAIFDWNLSSPWEIRVKTEPKYDELIINFFMKASPYPETTKTLAGELIYAVKKDEFKFICSVEIDKPEEILISIIGNYEEDYYDESKNITGELIFNNPWLHNPMFFTFNHYQDLMKFDTKADLRTPIQLLEYVEFTSYGNYSSNGDFKGSLQLIHGENKVSLEGKHNIFDENVIQELEFSINNFKLFYNLHSEWGDDANNIPTTAKGKMSITDLFGSDIDCTLNHKTESENYETSFFGSWDEAILQASHTLKYQSPTMWDSSFSFYIPEDGRVSSKISIDGKEDLSAVNIDMTFTSSWTSDFIIMYNKTFYENLSHQKIDVYYNNENLFNMYTIHTSLLSFFDQLNLKIDVSSPLFDNVNFKWIHELKSTFTNSINMYDIDIKYGSISYFKSKHKVEYYKNVWNLIPNSEKFTHYEMETSFVVPDLDVSFDSNLFVNVNNSVKFHFDINENIFDVNFSPMKAYGVLLKSHNFKSQFDIFFDKKDIPNLYIYGSNGEQFIKFKTNVESISPEFMSTASYDFNGNTGELKVNINFEDDDDVGNKSITGNFNFNSNFEMIKSLRVNFTYIRKDEEDMEFNNILRGYVSLNDVEYDGELEMILKPKYDDFKIFLKGSVNADSLSYGGDIGGSFTFIEEFRVSAQGSYSYVDDGYITGKGIDIDFKISPNYNTLLDVHLTENGISTSSFVFDLDIENIKFHLVFKPTEVYYYDFSAEQDGSKLLVKGEMVSDEIGNFTFIDGKISWILKQHRKQFIVNFSSDYDFISKINGQISVQSKRGKAAEIKLKINKSTFNANIRHISRKPGFNGKVTLKVKNDFYMPFQSDLTLVMNSGDGESKSILTIDLDGKKKWFVANVSVTLQEIKVKLNLPLDDLKNVNLTLTRDWEEKYSIIMKVEYGLKNKNAALKINAGIAQNFMDGHFIIESEVFNFNLTYDMSRKVELKFDFDSVYFDTENKLFNIHVLYDTDNKSQVDLILEFFINTVLDLEYNIKYNYDNESENKYSYSLSTELYERISRTEPYGVFSVIGSGKDFKIELKGYDPVDVSGFQITLENEMRFHGQEIPNMINVYYDQRLFGDHFKMSLSNEIINTDREIHFQSNFVSELEIFRYADMSGTYKYDDKTIEFLFNTPQGNTQGSGEFEILATSGSFKVDMTSDHHSFKNYMLEGSYFSDGEELSINFLSSQDEKEFNIKLSIKPEGQSNYFNIYIQTPFQSFDIFELMLKLERGEQPYNGTLSITLFGKTFELNVLHENANSWKYQDTNVLINLPHDGNQINLKFLFDIESLHTELYYANNERKLGMDIKINEILDTLNFEIKADFSLFNIGIVFTNVVIPIKISKQSPPYRFEFTHNFNSDKHGVILDTSFSLQVQPDIYSGEFKLISDHSIFGYSDITLDGSYEFFNGNEKNTLTLMGKLNDMEASAKINFGPNPFLSGHVIINTNIPKYERMNGEWKINIYGYLDFLMDLSLQIDGIGSTTLNISGYETGDEYGLEINFFSPFTHDHEIKYAIENDKENFKTYFTYNYNGNKYGVDFTSTQPRSSSIMRYLEAFQVSLQGNTPFKYISKFDLKYVHDSTSNLYDLILNYEGTSLKSYIFIDRNGNAGELELRFTSPFTNPFIMSTNWDSMENIYQCTINILSFELDFSNKDSNLKFFFKLPVGEYNTLNFNALYDFKDTNVKNLVGSTIFGDNYFSFEFIVKNLKGSKNGFDIQGNGNMNIYGTKGNMIFNSKILPEGDYSVSMNIRNEKSENIFFGLVALSDIELGIQILYMTEEILKIQCDIKDIIAVDLYISPYKHYFIDLNFTVTEHNNDYKVSFNLDTSESDALDLQATVSTRKTGGEANATLKIGNKEYKIDGKIDASHIRTEFSLMFLSSEDKYHPLNIKVKYDIKDFLKGEMNSMQEIAHASITWKDTLDISVLGMQNGNRLKVTFNLKTPFRQFPELKFGYDGEFLFKPKKIDFTYTIFAEWSERISLSNSFLYKDQDQQIDLSFNIKTPFKDFESIIITLKKESSNFVLSAKMDSKIWKFSIKLSESGFDAIIQTPIKNYELFVLTFAGDSWTSNTIILRYLGSDIFNIKFHVELWILEISIKTQWQLLQIFELKSELNTESEELRLNIEFELNGLATTFTFLMAPQRYFVNFILKSYEDEIGMLSFNYKEKGKTFDVNLIGKTPFQEFSSINGGMLYTPKKTTATLTIEQKTINLEFVSTRTDYILRIDESFFGNNFLHVKTDKSLLSLEGRADFQFPLEDGEFAVTFGYSITDNVEGEFYIQQISDVPFNLKMSLNIEEEEEMLTVTILSTTENAIKYKLQDFRFEIGLEMPRYEMTGGKIWSSLMHLDKNSNLYEFDLSFNYLYSVFSIELNMDDMYFTNKKYVLNISYDFENNMTVMYKIDNDLPLLLQWKYVENEWVMNVTILNYKNELILSLLDPSLENLSGSVKLISDFMEERTAELVFKFRVLDIFHYTLEISTLYGANDLNLNINFNYNKKMKNLEFEGHFKSSALSDHSLNLNVKMMQVYVMKLVLNTMGQTHVLQIKFNPTNKIINIDINSPFSKLPFENFSLEASNTGDGPIYRITDNFVEVNFKGNTVVKIDSETTYNNVALQFDTVYTDLNSILRNTNLLFKIVGDNEIFRFSAQSKNSNDELNIDIYAKYNDSDLLFKFDLAIDSGTLPGIYLTILIPHIHKFPLLHLGVAHTRQTEYQVELGGMDFTVLKADIETKYDAAHMESAKINIQIVEVFKLEAEYINHNEKIKLGATVVTPFKKWRLMEFYVNIPLTFEENEFWSTAAWNDLSLGMSTSYSFTTEKIYFRSLFQYMEANNKPLKYMIHIEKEMENKQVMFAYIQYPEKKIGLEYKWTGSFADFMKPCIELEEDAVFIFRVNLPFEKYDIISIEQSIPSYCTIGNMLFKHDTLVPPLKSEIRIGSVGYSFSILASSVLPDVYIFDAQFNDYKIEGQLTSYLDMVYNTMSLRIASEPTLFMPIDIKLDVDKKFKLEIQQNSVNLLRVFFSWEHTYGVGFTINIYPHTFIFNIESDDELDDYQIEFSINYDWWNEKRVGYGLHFHQDHLDAGRHLILEAVTPENNFGVDMTLAYNSHTFNDSLILNYNENKIGYLIDFNYSPSYLNEVYTGDLQLIMFDRTVHWNHMSVATLGGLSSTTDFYWNNRNPDELPIKLQVDYSDRTIFGFENHYFIWVFSHPEVENLVLEGNVTESLNGTQHINVMFNDKNVANSKINLQVDSHPVTDNGQYQVIFNFNHPFSGFETIAEVKVTKERCHIATKYWSLTQEEWLYMDILSDYESKLHLDMFSNNKYYGYAFTGNMNREQSGLGMTLEGLSKQSGNKWEVGMSMETFLPELSIHILANEKAFNSTQAQRLRIGLQSPREMGVYLDHKTFSGWHQDAEASLELETSDILQLEVKYDPTMDVLTNLNHLVTINIFDPWKSDISRTYNDINSWFTKEMVPALDILFSTPTFTTMFHKESQNVEMFIRDFDWMLGTTQRGVVATLDALVDALQDVYQSVEPSAIQILNEIHYLQESIENRLLQEFAPVSYALENFKIFWDERVQEDIDLFIQEIQDSWIEFSELVTKGFQDLMYHMVRWINTALQQVEEPLGEVYNEIYQWLEKWQNDFDRCFYINKLIEINHFDFILEKYAANKRIPSF